MEHYIVMEHCKAKDHYMILNDLNQLSYLYDDVQYVLF